MRGEKLLPIFFWRLEKIEDSHELETNVGKVQCLGGIGQIDGCVHDCEGWYWGRRECYESAKSEMDLLPVFLRPHGSLFIQDKMAQCKAQLNSHYKPFNQKAPYLTWKMCLEKGIIPR